MTVEIIPDKAVSRIPRIDLVYSVGNAPVYVSSSKHLYTIPEQKIEGKFVCEIDLPSPLAKNTFVKPFLSESGSNYQLKLASGSSNKVS